MSFNEYWAVMRTANPDLDKDINTDNGKFFTDEEEAELDELMRKYG